MMVKREKVAARAAHACQTYYFCSHACQKSFQANPGVYVRGPEKVHVDSRPGHG